jgi:hypothetical protein
LVRPIEKRHRLKLIQKLFILFKICVRPK